MPYATRQPSPPSCAEHQEPAASGTRRSDPATGVTSVGAAAHNRRTSGSGPNREIDVVRASSQQQPKSEGWSLRPGSVRTRPRSIGLTSAPGARWVLGEPSTAKEMQRIVNCPPNPEQHSAAGEKCPSNGQLNETDADEVSQGLRAVGGWVFVWKGRWGFFIKHSMSCPPLAMPDTALALRLCSLPRPLHPRAEWNGMDDAAGHANASGVAARPQGPIRSGFCPVAANVAKWHQPSVSEREKITVAALEHSQTCHWRPPDQNVIRRSRILPSRSWSHLSSGSDRVLSGTQHGQRTRGLSGHSARPCTAEFCAAT